MNLALNYSKPAAALVAESRIDIDYFKCPDWPDMVADALHYRPVAVHFSLRAGSGLLHKSDWGLIEQLMKLTGTPYVNLHLDPRTHDFTTKTGYVSADNLDPALISRVEERLLADVRAVVNHFGPELVIAENVAYWGANGKTLYQATDTGLIRNIIEETDCGLLLDISHARIAARYRGADEATYIASLPIKRTREVHITGVHATPSGWLDHLSMLTDDWPWVDHVLENIRSGIWGSARLLAFEYGGEGNFFSQNTDPVVIAEQVPELWKRLKMDG